MWPVLKLKCAPLPLPLCESETRCAKAGRPDRQSSAPTTKSLVTTTRMSASVQMEAQVVLCPIALMSAVYSLIVIDVLIP